ncbi:MAG: hypothetical protein JXA89_22215 [Anaerolineae bacterium]|nr:hypothetical protein [Anaerolineae bacterium]
MTENGSPDCTVTYQIQVEGQVDASWSDWFSGMSCAYGDGITTLIGPVVDQAALRGVLFKIWDLNLNLISVNRVDETRG